MKICLLCEGVCICIIIIPFSCPELSVFHFVVQQRLASLQRHFVLAYVFDQQHTEHLPLLECVCGEHIIICGLTKKNKFKRAVWKLQSMMLQLPGSHLCPCISLALKKPEVCTVALRAKCWVKMARCPPWLGSFANPHKNRCVVLTEDCGKVSSYCEYAGDWGCRHFS